jgi:NAD(P)-dependent dehydrogenase (short-subunit alcohol dehydrogenase family)
MAQGRFQDHHIAISGAGTGIGRAIALRFAREGARLSLFARDGARVERAAAECRGAGASSVLSRAVDIRRGEQVEQAFVHFAAAHGPLFAAVANSGIAGPNTAGAHDRFEELVQTNLLGTYATLRAAQRHLAPGPGARHLVVLSSILARIGVPQYTGYCASKAGLLGLVRALAAELAPANVQVNAVCPGWVATDMAWQGLDAMARDMQSTREAVRDLMLQQVPLRRMAEPEDVAGLVAWLVSLDARGVTGQGLDINGGAFMH